jgi:ankyrin repeat protein
MNVVQLLFKYKADLCLARNDGITPLFIACEKNHVEIAKFLIDNVTNLSDKF